MGSTFAFMGVVVVVVVFVVAAVVVVHVSAERWERALLVGYTETTAGATPGSNEPCCCEM